MVFSKKSKCSGCVALIVGKRSYSCALGYGLEYEKINKQPAKPKPTEACYRPNEGELEKAKELTKKRRA